MGMLIEAETDCSSFYYEWNQQFFASLSNRKEDNDYNGNLFRIAKQNQLGG
jgi:hypothetical protein